MASLASLVKGPAVAPGGAGGAQKIQVRPDELIKIAGTCENIAKNLKNHLDNMHSILNEFFNSDVFEGKQAAELRANYTRTRQGLENFPQLVAFFGVKLQEAAQAFKIADTDDATMMAAVVAHSEVLPHLPAHLQAEFAARGDDPSFWDKAVAWLKEHGGRGVSAALAVKTLLAIKSGTNIVFKNMSLQFGGGAKGMAENAKGLLPKATNWLLTKAAPLLNKINPKLAPTLLSKLTPENWAKFAKGTAIVGAIATTGLSIYKAFTGEDKSPATIAGTISSGLVRSAMGFHPVGAAVLAGDAIIQFAGPIIADVMKSNAGWLAGGGLQEKDIASAADKFGKAISDVSIDGRLTGAFTALYKGDIGGVFNEVMTMRKGIVNAVDSGSQLAGAAVGGLVNKIIPGSGGIVGTAVEVGAQLATQTLTLPLRLGNFAVDLFTGNAKLGDIVSGPGNYVGRLLDQVGLKGAGDFVRDVSGKVGSAISKAQDTVVNFVKDTAVKVGEGIKNAAVTVGEGIKSVANKVGNFFKSLF